MTEKQLTDGPSPLGYHFLTQYQRCPRSWWFRYTMGLRPVKTKTPLLFGHAWHKCCEFMLEGHTLQESIDAGVADLVENRGRFYTDEDYTESLYKLETGAPVWYQSMKDQLEGGKVLGTEIYKVVPLAAGLQFTARFDGLFEDTHGARFVLEHKTTAWQAEKTANGVDLDDQATAYYLAYSRAYPDEPPLAGVLLDVTEFKKYETKVSWWYITRTADDVINVELSLIGLFYELNQKTQGLKDGRPAFELFPRSGAFCSLFGCEYEDICRKRVEQGPLPPSEDFEVVEYDTTKDDD